MGFLGTGATLSADINLLIQLAMGCMLLVGMWLARKKRFVAHKYCQSSVMLLNLVMIGIIMYPSFHRQVGPRLGAIGGDFYLAVATVHAGLGAIAELLGLYIVLVAAKLLPRKLRFKRYKPWMRTELALWWMVILIGIGTYYTWYVRQPKSGTQNGDGSAAVQSKLRSDRATVTISNFSFEPKEMTVAVGTTVEWVDSTGRHTVEADDGSFKSDTLVASGRFERKFDQAGAYPYHCGFHGSAGVKDMAGVITVKP
jgi:plastocyanin/uncharacterized membrane protein YozB (DUF420 family)